jgi:hypothetical protein
LKAKLLNKATNRSNNTKQFPEEIQTNVCQFDHTWNVFLQRYLSALDVHESELMGEDRNHFVEFFCELGIGSVPELNVFGKHSHTIDVTEVRDCIYFVNVTEKYLWTMDYFLKYLGVKAVEVGRGNINSDSYFEKVKVFERANGRRVESDIVGKCEEDIEVCFMEGWKVKLFSGCEVKEDIDGMCFDPAHLNEDDLENSLELSDYDIHQKSSGDILRFTTNAEELYESEMIEEGIENGNSKMEFESDEIDDSTVYFELSFCRFVEGFCFSDISDFGCIDVILSSETIFPCACPLWSSFNLIAHESENGNENVNCLFKKEVMMRNLEIIYLMMTNDGTDCDRFFSQFFSENPSESSVERNRYFFSSVFVMEREIEFEAEIDLEMDIIFRERMMRNEWNETEVLTNQMFWYSDNDSQNDNDNVNVNVNESIVSEMYEIREILELGGGSRIEGFSSFSGTKSTEVLEIGDSVEIISQEDFTGYKSLNKIIFSSSSHLREISGFHGCTSLCRIEFPSSVEVIGKYGFDKCTSLNEVVFSSCSRLREISGFDGCTSLCRIELHSSVEVIGKYGFNQCTSLRVVIVGAGCRMRANGRFCKIKAFFCL